MPQAGSRGQAQAPGAGGRPPRPGPRWVPGAATPEAGPGSPAACTPQSPKSLMNMKGVDDFGEAGGCGAVESVISGPSLEELES